MSDNDDELERARERLRTMLTDAGFRHEESHVPGGRQMNFTGTYRDWQLYANMTPAWFHVRTMMCAMPANAGIRGDLSLHLMRANNAMSLLKYSVTKSDNIVLECEMRAEHLDVESLKNAVYYLHSQAEDDYLGILRIVRGEPRLEELSNAFARETAAGERGAE
jgi:hypothetical protein